MQGLTWSIWFTCPSGMWFWKFTCAAKIFTCPANICTSHVKIMYTAWKIITCPDWKITCPVGHMTTNICVPWDKIYMPRACGHDLMLSPGMSKILGIPLTHWGRVTHICIGKLTIISSDNGLSPERRQAIIWSNAGILLIGPLGTNFSEIFIEIQTFPLKKIRLKMSSAKCCSFRLGLNVLIFDRCHCSYVTPAKYERGI